MQLIDKSRASATITLSRDELLIVNAALNEICHGIDVFEFETRIGANRERVHELLKQVASLVDAE